jgi:hypothetical protein
MQMSPDELKEKITRNTAIAELAFMDWLSEKSTTNWDAYEEAKEAAQDAQRELDELEKVTP